MHRFIYVHMFFVLECVTIQSLLSVVSLFFHNVSLNVLVCVYVTGKEQRKAQIADMCSFYLLEEKGNAMRILADRVSGQTEEEETAIIHKSAGKMIERLIANTLTTQLKTHPNILLLL